MTQGRLMQFSTRWASIAIFVLIAIGAAHAQGALVAIDLGPQAGSPPERENDWQNAVRIDRFILAFGNSVHIQTTPTSVSLQWDEAALYVHFVCADPDPFYRDGVRLRRSDRVEVGLLPPGARQSELWQFSVDETGDAFVTHRSYKTTLQGAKVSAVGGVWTAALTIVWPPFGGVPSKPFMLQLARVRSITGEVLSPSAVDFHDGPVTTEFAPAAADEFIEVNLGGTKGIRTADFGLITLPSGTRRWERRAVLHKATGGELKEIMGLQQELDTQPTSETNLADRVRLAEIWYDLLDQEGFSFNAESETWLPGKGELDPWTARHEFNDSLRSGDSAAAGRVLDSLLQHFNRVSKTWFADGTPGDAHEDSWAEIDAIDSVTATSNEMVLHARAAQRSFDLVLSFPSSGGLRLHGPDAGFFTPDALSPMEVKRTENEVRATANHLTVEIGLKADWHLDILSANYPQPIWNLRRGDLRIHPDSRGQVAAVEMRGRLSPPEGIFGMGERFDSFNQRGRTLTLWQLDAWDSLVHGGLENQAYKPIPLWHSTAGYSVFWNSSYQIRADFGNARQDEYRIVAHGPNLDLYVWSGDSQTALRGYSSLTGKPLLPPVWAFEPWMGGGGDRWGKDVGKTPAQAILAVVDKFHQLDIPHSSVYAEG